MKAACACGALGAEAPDGAAQFVVACHCRACQRRSGSPFGAGLYFPTDSLATAGESVEFARSTDSGGRLRNHFCARCGSTLWWTIDARPDLIGVALGALISAVPAVPILSLWERSRHDWIALEGVSCHHPLGLPA